MKNQKPLMVTTVDSNARIYMYGKTAKELKFSDHDEFKQKVLQLMVHADAPTPSTENDIKSLWLYGFTVNAGFNVNTIDALFFAAGIVNAICDGIIRKSDHIALREAGRALVVAYRQGSLPTSTYQEYLLASQYDNIIRLQQKTDLFYSPGAKFLCWHCFDLYKMETLPPKLSGYFKEDC